jgi:MoaA/NifB/PqqE/SkfB family radical SAM enzyme
VVAWVLTSRCNQRCAHCGCWCGEEPELDPDRALDLARRIARSGVLAVSLQGGEPLLHPQLGSILRILDRSGLRTRLTSNGRLVPDRLQDLAPLDSLKISLDGPEAVHDRLRGAGSHRAALVAIDAARAVRLPVRVATVLSAPSIGSLEQHLEQLRRLELRATFNPLERRSSQTVEVEPSPHAMRAALARLEGLARRGDPRIGSSPAVLAALACWPRPPVTECQAGALLAMVMPDGRVLSCEQVPQAIPDDWDGWVATPVAQRRVGPCDGCQRSNTAELSLAATGALDAVRSVLRMR